MLTGRAQEKTGSRCSSFSFLAGDLGAVRGVKGKDVELLLIAQRNFAPSLGLVKLQPI